jgi:hypothetical protein
LAPEYRRNADVPHFGLDDAMNATIFDTDAFIRSCVSKA